MMEQQYWPNSFNKFLIVGEAPALHSEIKNNRVRQISSRRGPKQRFTPRMFWNWGKSPNKSPVLYMLY